MIVWTRFQAAQVPPDQVVAAYPRGELVAIASTLLLLFGFLGLFAVVVFYLINKRSGGTIGMSRGLLALLAAEGVVAIAALDSATVETRVIAAELFLLPVLFACWGTFLYERPALSRSQDSKEDAGQGQRNGKPSSQLRLRTYLEALIARVKELLRIPDSKRIAAERAEEKEREKEWQERLDVVEFFQRRSLFNRVLFLTVVWVAVPAGVLLLLTNIPSSSIYIGGLALIGALPTLFLLLHWVKNPSKERVLKPGEVPFTRDGQVLILALTFLAVIGPLVLLGKLWVVVSILAAAFLTAMLWRVAVLTNGKFRWYGLSVFVSVLLFGTVAGILRNIADPQVQPIALIRETDGPDESLEGLYVTETDDHVYFATVATQGCTDDIVPDSGRLLWVPKDEVVAMAVGPPQSVDDAAKTALEMSHALTPSVGASSGDHVSLNMSPESGASEPTQPGRRLENVGDAVQPDFGAGSRLEPETASPGDLVTLRMSLPKHQDGVNGFGRRREGRTVRVDGIPADIAKEQAGKLLDVEYLEAGNGLTVKLHKGAIYTEEGGEYVRLSPDQIGDHGRLYLKIEDRSVVRVRDLGLATEKYLRVKEEVGGAPELERTRKGFPEVDLRSKDNVRLHARLLRQSWHPGRIKFRVPNGASTGTVTVDCEQLSGQPLLKVAQPPQARIDVRIEPGSRQVIFDSSHSNSYKDTIVSRHWTIEGLDGGVLPRITKALPPSKESYAVRLTVKDTGGRIGTSEVHLLRLPSHLVSLDHRAPRRPHFFKKVKEELRSAVTQEPAATIEFDMHPGESGKPLNPEKTFARVNRIRRGLLESEGSNASTSSANSDGLTVKTLAFGITCPAERGSEEGRLDVLVLGDGAKVAPPKACPVLRVRTAHLLLPPS